MFYWRMITKQDNLSVHSFGAAIDPDTKFADYWTWSGGKPGNVPAYENKFPWKSSPSSRNTVSFEVAAGITTTRCISNIARNCWKSAGAWAYPPANDWKPDAFETLYRRPRSFSAERPRRHETEDGALS
jgi:hypothetical protein